MNTYDAGTKRECVRCGRVKDAWEFPARRHAPGGHLKTCLICWRKQHQGKYRHWYKTKQRNKTCTDCRERLPLSRFYRDKKQPDGRSPICKKCKRWQEAAQPPVSQVYLGLEGKRRCRMCQQIKPLEQFYYRADMLFEHGYRCLDCCGKRREELRRKRREPPPKRPSELPRLHNARRPANTALLKELTNGSTDGEGFSFEPETRV